MLRYRFGDFELDLAARQLSLRGATVHLERRPLDLLILLVRHRDRLVPRDEIIASLWPAKVIIDFDSGLNTLVRKIRAALGDDADEPKFIDTVPGRGYRFIAPVVEVTQLVSGVPPASESALPRSRFARLLVAVLFITGAAAFLWQSELLRPDQMRIAVLPFENLTGRQELSYMAAGLAEETSMSLARIDLPDLAVIGGVSARAIASSEQPLREAGRKIGVDYVVQSALQLDGSRLRVTAQLINLRSSEQLWSAVFDRELTNVLGLQRELSIAIAEQVRQRLSLDVVKAVERRQTQNPQAYELYLKGRYEWGQFLPGSVARAVHFYEQAVANDPEYALAWAGIAHVFIMSPMTADAEPRSTLPAAKDALQRALEYGPDLAETQLALGSYELFLGRNWAGAQEAARSAVELDPNNALAHMFYGIALSQLDQHVEAREMLRRARELDPLFPLMFANSAVVALQAGDPQSALEFAKQAVAIKPEFWVGHFQLGNALLELNEAGAALSAFTEAAKMSAGNSKAVSARAYVLAGLGREVEARAILAELQSSQGEKFVPPYAVAVIHAGLGEVESTFEWLDRAEQIDDVHLTGLAKDPKFAALHADPRFAALLERCGPQAESAASIMSVENKL